MATLPLTDPPPLRLSIDRPINYAKAIVRTFFEDSQGRRSCLDTPLLARSWAFELANKIARTGAEVEVIGLRYQAIKPAPWQVHRTKNLGLHRLNKVSGLVRIEHEAWWRALPEDP